MRPVWKRNLFRYLDTGGAERALEQLWLAAPSPETRRRVNALADGLSVSLPPPAPDPVETPWKEELRRKYGSGVESDAHRELKEWVAAHPEAVGLNPDARGQTEFRFPSGDRVDVAFFHPRHDRLVHVVEIELAGEPELRVGTYQAVKYQALALTKEQGHTSEVGASLVAQRVGKASRELATSLGVTAFATTAK